MTARSEIQAALNTLGGIALGAHIDGDGELGDAIDNVVELIAAALLCDAREMEQQVISGNASHQDAGMDTNGLSRMRLCHRRETRFRDFGEDGEDSPRCDDSENTVTESELESDLARHPW